MSSSTATQRTIYLASSSPRRHELVRMLQLPVHIYPSDADETIEPSTPPIHMVEQLSLRKAVAVRDQLLAESIPVPDGIILGSDTIVVLNGQVLGKPKDTAHAYEMLSALQGNTHEVLTGIALLDLHTHHSIIKHRLTKVTMKSLTPNQIDRYIATGEPKDKAGSYAIQGIGATLIDSIDGCYFNVVGLPISLLSDMLSEMGMGVLN
ncbi:MAG: Maf family protein [Paenibacillaceae bacterium]